MELGSLSQKPSQLASPVHPQQALFGRLSPAARQPPSGNMLSPPQPSPGLHYGHWKFPEAALPLPFTAPFMTRQLPNHSPNHFPPLSLSYSSTPPPSPSHRHLHLPFLHQKHPFLTPSCPPPPSPSPHQKFNRIRNYPSP